ncbi:heme oxygenase (biliverdin-producing) [Actinomadura atramentaria]|uniref:biliverdin-producing heme oxygenase n=1 Tax=Actinomadura atramentaria TaxID=1990 RepID=UPI0003A6A750|nr:biliverdin-producing heme oxygenase [Actinomadura atramentaria]
MSMAGHDEGFAAELRAATRSDHGENETSAYMAALVGGRLGGDEYAALIEQLHPVYELLERAAEALADDPVAGPFALPGLARLRALETDLAHFRGPRWRERVALLPSTARYCDRLRDVAFDWPGGFVAHHYTRYLGDLSGGQFIGRQVRRVLGLGEDDPGVLFYRFEGKPKDYKDAYRALLDAAPWDAAERARVIDEVRTAYRFNAEMAADLSRALSIEPAA